MIPALLGNIVGGGVFVGVVYWYLYLAMAKDEVIIDGKDYGGPPTALFGVSASVEELPSKQIRRESEKTMA